MRVPKVSTNKAYKNNYVPEYMNTYILTEGSNLKIFSKENYAIPLDSRYLFTKKKVKHGIEHDIDSG